MKTPVLIGALLVLGAGLVYGHPTPKEVQRRTPWSSIRKFNYNPDGGNVVQAWPCPGVSPRNLYPVCPIRYCFYDEASYVALRDTVQAGIKLWQPALKISNLRFVPQFGEGVKTICSDPRVPYDTLRIRLRSAPEGEPGGPIGADANIGYHLITEAGLRLLGKTYSHELNIGRAPPQVKCAKAHTPQDPSKPDSRALYFPAGVLLQLIPNAPNTPNGWFTGQSADGAKGLFPGALCTATNENLAYDAWNMAHELGHVAGLQHEHQRTDAASQLSFDCSLLPGYNEVASAIEKKTKNRGYQNGDTIQKACHDRDTAMRYKEHYPKWSPEALMVLDESDHRGAQPMSPKLDFESIMMYPSYTLDGMWRQYGRREPFPNDALMWKLDPSAPGGKTEILPGGIRINQENGAFSYLQSRVSEGDIARIAQLYPTRDTKNNAAVNKAEWKDTSEGT